MLKEALLYKKEEHRAVTCAVCSHRCRVSEGKAGICGVRRNEKGTFYSTVYGEAVASHVDPIEKKPLFHLLPGSTSYSIATVGCNFHCGFCQNWEISQAGEATRLRVDSEALPPETIVAQAKRFGCRSISYTYTEPTVFFEYALDTARLAKKDGLLNVFVTNGYMTEEALVMIGPYLDAANVDLKAFSESYYRKVCGGNLEKVLHIIRKMKELGIWVELTTLVVPGMNDSREELEKLAGFIASVGVDIPWHISRFHPEFKITNLAATPVATLKAAYDIGRKANLRYVYLGNVNEAENTVCYRCGKPVITRLGFTVTAKNMKDGACASCGSPIEGIQLGS